jgi:hypothetical protein
MIRVTLRSEPDDSELLRELVWFMAHRVSDVHLELVADRLEHSSASSTKDIA